MITRSHRGDTHPDENSYILQVEAKLDAHLAAERDRRSGRYPSMTVAFDSLHSFVLGGGTRLRPRFAYWGFVGAGG